MILESKWKWTLAACFVLGSLYLMGSGAIQSAYSLIENSGTPVTRRQTLNFTSGVTCVDDSMNLSTDCSSSGGGGSAGGLVTYNGVALAVAATGYIPVGGSTPTVATEAEVEIPIAATGTASSLYMSLAAAPGTGNAYAFTVRHNGASTTVTCTISGATATTCNDTTHTFSVTAGDLVDIQVVTTGSALAGGTVSESMLLPAGSGGGSSITFVPPYLYNGTNYFVAATGYQATKPTGSSFTYINGINPPFTASGTNGDYVYGGTTATQYFQTQTCTTSVEAEFTAESVATGGGGTGAAGIWVWDSTNSHLFDFEFVAAMGSIELEGYEFSYSGSGSPSPIGAYYGPYGAFGTQPVQHYKMSVSGGTLTVSYSIDGGGAYIPVNTQSVGTLGGCGTTLLAPGVIDILSLVIN